MTAQATLVYALSLLALVWLANFVVIQYGRGAVHAAIDEGVRSGSRLGASVQACESRASEVLDNLFGGAMGRGVAVRCRMEGDRVVAEAKGAFASWAPPVPTYRFDLSAVALRSTVPR